jgi:hypothetical protein
MPRDARLAQAARYQTLLSLPPETSPAVQAIDVVAASRNFAAQLAAA